METDQITVTEDGRRIVGWQDGATVARIIWKHEEHDEHVHGREVDNEGTAVAVLYAVDNSRYQLVSAELVSAVTLGDLVAAIAPGYRDVVLVETDLKTQRCTCADEVLYKVTVNSPNGSTVMSSLTSSLVPSVTDFQRKQDSSAEITVEQYPNPEYRPECRRDIVEDEVYIKYIGAGGGFRYDKVYCRRCGVALWGRP